MKANYQTKRMRSPRFHERVNAEPAFRESLSFIGGVMNRKEFLRNCASGLCACAAVNLVPVASLSAAEPVKTEDWRWSFVRHRYAKMLEILSGRMDEKMLNETLHEVGTFCSSTQDEWTIKHRNDIDGYCKSVEQSSSGDHITYDREKGIVTMVSPDRTECWCPLNCADTPKIVCNCSLGWQQHTWETILQKKVKVELKESVLRGGKRCVFEIRVQNTA
jgi:hypothetical protein